MAVVGGGITGALAAYHLAEAGADVMLVDRRDIGGGSTAATTGLLVYEIDTPLLALAGAIGEAAAAQCYRLCVEANRAFAPLVETLGDSCGLTAKKCLYLASKEQDVEGLRQEREIRRRHGIRVDLLEREEIAERFSFARPAALDELRCG